MGFRPLRRRQIVHVLCFPPRSIDDTNRKNEIASLVRENTSIKIENASLKSENLLLRDEISSLKAKLRSLSLCSLCQAPIVVPSERDSIFPRDTSISTAVDEPSTNDEDVTGDELASRFQQFSLESVKNKIFKTAGSFALANDAMAMKERYLGGPVASHARRRLFWDTLPWEKGPYECHYVFPQPDLITSLVQVYFATVHATFPVLHRPSFERPLAEGLHLTDHDFGGLLLAVLAVASRYSDDPRVLVEGDDTVLSAGWKYANQIQIILGKSPDPSIYEVQMYALCSRYVLGTSRPEVCSLYTDLGISCLRLRGEYRRKRDEHNVNLQDEEWRRVFWQVFYLVFDRMGCVFHGRPPGFDLEDEDVDLPLEVDDEYWERGFVQPLGKPPLQSYLVQHARLCIILGDAMRRLYVSTETKMRFGWHGSEWERSTVAELDSAMNDFLDSIPPHLRWDPVSPPQGTFFDQSLALHVAFQHIQITIHRPYIHKMGALAGPALSICTGAARSILHMASVWLARRRWQPPTLMNSVFVSGIILVLNMFNTKRAHPGLSMDLKKDLAHVDTAMEVMKVLESRQGFPSSFLPSFFPPIEPPNHN
ncbi:fungal-specific transcription factor domain-containing protein [Mycena filopes]|nr:fungal-specific transcription factor domain-containing protein [Mycena filopes]